MALGYGGHAEWRDMSEYLVHLTPTANGLESILATGAIYAVNPYGAVRRHRELEASQRVVCLSEIPLDHMSRLAERHGTFGVAFDRRTLSRRGAAPVWYLQRGTPAQSLLFRQVADLAYRSQPDVEHWLWRLTPFIDYPGEYDVGGSQVTYEWSWEREWRLAGNLVFGPGDVRFLYAPEAHHASLTMSWNAEVSGRCPPLLDAAWPLERLQQVAVAADL